MKYTPDEKVIMNRLARWKRQSVARTLIPNERVSKCLRVRTRELIDVLKSEKYKRAHYAGLITCGSVWHCPVCTAKITERRRIELQSAIDKASTLGLNFFMVTWTLQHNKQDNLQDVSTCLTDALTKTKSGRWYQEFIEDFEIIGNVTSSEVTYGTEHGWHFHKHSIYFSNKKINDYEEIKKSLHEQYSKKLNALGRYAHPIYGVDVRAGDNHVSGYVSKYGHENNKSNWSLSAEMTKIFSKNALGEKDHFSPFELLDLFFHGEKEAGHLFQHYAKAMRGVKQLRYSPNIKKMLCVIEISDEEIASLQDDKSYLFAQITLEQWRKILKAEKRGQVIEVASAGNADYLQTYIKSL